MKFSSRLRMKPSTGLRWTGTPPPTIPCCWPPAAFPAWPWKTARTPLPKPWERYAWTWPGPWWRTGRAPRAGSRCAWSTPKPRRTRALAADAVAHSPLVKTAVFGRDANWGRIVAAVGRSGAVVNPQVLDLWFDDVLLVAGCAWKGADAEERATLAMDRPGFVITVDLNQGEAGYEMLTCDPDSGLHTHQCGIPLLTAAHGLRGICPGKPRHGFDVGRLGKHVHGLDLFHAIVLGQDFQVPGQGGGVAGNVHHGMGSEIAHQGPRPWDAFRFAGDPAPLPRAGLPGRAARPEYRRTRTCSYPLDFFWHWFGRPQRPGG